MPWQHDDVTGEWVMVDEPAAVTAPAPAAGPTPLAQPAPPPAPEPSPRPDMGGFSNPDLAYPPPAEPTYNNEDDAAKQRYLEEQIFSKGWTTDAATGEIIDEDGNVVGRVPSFYRMT